MKPGNASLNKSKSLSDSKVSQADVMEELETIRKDYARASLQLTQQETFINHLKDSGEKKDAVIAHLEDELRNAEEIHQQEIAVIQEEAQTSQLEGEHRIRFLELEVSRLTEENAIYTRFEEENKDMRQTLLAQQEQMEKLRGLNESLRNKASEDMASFRAQLEEEFKRRLMESEKKFQAEAYRTLNDEAKQALQGNDHLQTVLAKQNDSIESVLGRCKQLESSHANMKMEQELAVHSLHLHSGEVQKLRQQLSDSKSRCQQLEESLQQRRIERASLELLYMEYETTRKELQKTSDKLRTTQRQNERMKNRISALQNEGPADGRLRSIQQHTGDLSRQHRRAASRLDEVSSDEDVEDGGYEAGNAPRPKVDPMEILAMWNVNFENWKPPGIEEDLKDVSGLTEPESVPTGPPRPPPADRPRKMRQTVAQQRLDKDRELSVLSKRKFKSLPPNANQYQGPRTKLEGVVEHGPFTVAEGQIHFGTKQSSSRFLVP
mmetsp:Transcript_11183/g.20125  ORF Transcript_11183/g.20125 Transcript_11183/m.20125 type:complete len:493 (-) Transcript_11183:1012-2490(-)